MTGLAPAFTGGDICVCHLRQRIGPTDNPGALRVNSRFLDFTAKVVFWNGSPPRVTAWRHGSEIISVSP